MNQQKITLEPQIVHFGTENKQLIKIINKTGQTITNCFFCLFNTSKYQFNPQSFKLDPWQHKIVTISIINKSFNLNGKQFAYIKSKNFSKRITLCIDTNLSQEKMKSPSSGRQQIYTLTSRDYRDAQKTAFDRVIAQKQAYIKRLQRRLQQQEQSNRKDRSFTSEGKNKNKYLKQIQELQKKIQEDAKQNQRLLHQNNGLKQKMKQLQQLLLKKTSGNQSLQVKQIQKIVANKQQTISNLKQDIYYLEQQLENMYVTISQKQEKIKKYEKKNDQIVDQLMKDSDKRLKQLQHKIEEEKRKNKEKVRKLQDKLSQSQVSKNKKGQLEHQIAQKQKQLHRLEMKLEQQKKKKKQVQEQRKRALKIQLQNQSLTQQNNLLRSKVENLQKSVDELRQQTFIYKSKVDQTSFDKANKYLQVALQICKNQNQLLKRSRKQLEYSLAQQSKSRKNYESRYLELQQKVKNLKQQIQNLNLEKSDLISRSRLTYNQSHDTIMKLRSQNIDLIEKMNFGPKNHQKLEKLLDQSNVKLKKSEEQLKRIKAQAQQNQLKLKQIQQAKQKMAKKIEKYKKQTTRQLKSISQSTVDQLKKLKQQKKQLLSKVNKLQQQMKNQKQKSREREKNQSITNIDSTYVNLNDQKHDKNQLKTRYPASQSQRRTGIKNQRKAAQQSNSFNKNEDMQHLYCELGELRQFKNYILLQIKKFKKALQLVNGQHAQQELNQNNSLIYNCVNIFQLLRTRINQQNSDRQKIAQTQKQLCFLKGRLTELQNVSKYMKNNDLTQQKISSIQNYKAIGFQDRNLLELVRSQMKNQYKKMYDSLQISQQKFELLKRKLYEQYRSRIISSLNSKQKIDNTTKMLKIETVLERFVDGLANKSHRQAILAKQVRLKQEARKQAGFLKDKVNHLNQLLQTRKGYCNRDPVKVYGCQNEPQWHDNIRLQARMLTYQAENARLLQQIGFHQTQSKNFEQQLKFSLEQLQIKQQEMTKLKKEIIQISSENAKQLIRRQQNIQELQKKFLTLKQERKESQNEKRKTMDKQYVQLRQQIERKKQIIKNLKQKQKMLQQLVQSSNRSDQSHRNRNKRQMLQQIRLQESLRQFKQNNRQLRSENSKLKQQISALQSEIQKKNSLIKRLKGQGQQHRIRSVKQDVDQNSKLKLQIKQLKKELKILKNQAQKSKKKKDKQIMQLQSEMRKIKNQSLIEKSSLQSIIRALSDSFKRLYSDLCIIAKKKGKSVQSQLDFEDLLEKPADIDSLKVYESFQQVLKLIKL